MPNYSVAILFLLLGNSTICHAQDSIFLKVHFLYGSKPKKQYKNMESKWFGGMLGGHVGIEVDSNRILSFIPNGRFHWFAKDKDRHSSFAIHDYRSFYAIMGGNADSNKKAIVRIPISIQQRRVFDSISTIYLAQAPYDYALFGMRCASAAYDILGQLNILPPYSYGKTYKKIFYPRKLRKSLFPKAHINNWAITRLPGSNTRKWEKD